MMNTNVRSHTRRTPSGGTTTVKKHSRKIGDRYMLSGSRTFTIKSKPFTSGGQRFYAGTTTTPRSNIEVPETVNEKKLTMKEGNNTQPYLDPFWDKASPSQKVRVKRLMKNLNIQKDEQAVRELTLSVDNKEPLYRQKVAIEENLDKKREKGNYSRQLALLSFYNVVENANRDYKKDFGYNFSSVSKAHASDSLLRDYEMDRDINFYYRNKKGTVVSTQLKTEMEKTKQFLRDSEK